MIRALSIACLAGMVCAAPVAADVVDITRLTRSYLLEQLKEHLGPCEQDSGLSSLTLTCSDEYRLQFDLTKGTPLTLKQYEARRIQACLDLVADRTGHCTDLDPISIRVSLDGIRTGWTIDGQDYVEWIAFVGPDVIRVTLAGADPPTEVEMLVREAMARVTLHW